MSAHVLAFCPYCKKPITWLGFERKDFNKIRVFHVVSIGICSFGLSNCDCEHRGGEANWEATK